jgi:hypothetical protein
MHSRVRHSARMAKQVWHLPVSDSSKATTAGRQGVPLDAAFVAKLNGSFSEFVSAGLDVPHERWTLIIEKLPFAMRRPYPRLECQVPQICCGRWLRFSERRHPATLRLFAASAIQASLSSPTKLAAASILKGCSHFVAPLPRWHRLKLVQPCRTRDLCRV